MVQQGGAGPSVKTNPNLGAQHSHIVALGMAPGTSTCGCVLILLWSSAFCTTAPRHGSIYLFICRDASLLNRTERACKGK